ncbi:hypothetical protein CLI64_28010 [Nostoc sp. CENA543]|uniref:hypothetical protein n=1 Tax=Nostoc sp. CENA543 TaxID=1869241 RepID=UPI000CA0B741|nr:hypothetical protein [Nostoc sp. CENA543]AUT03920.1 hypothetical protein CLI64_28010 [Nostoc sp. CENA543]
MSGSIQYLTNQNGERVGVLLDLATYQQLTNSSLEDDEILTGLNLEELQALADSMLSTKAQSELDNLLERNTENLLSDQEKVTLDCLLAQIDQLNILKTRARYTLKIKGISQVA